MTERVRILEWWRITSDGQETARAVCPSCGVSGSLEDHEIADDCPNRQPEDVRAITDVIDERQRQIRVEGWTPEHDDGHSKGELAQAAYCYVDGYVYGVQPGKAPVYWPWVAEAWKPKDPRRDLVRAAALIVAEIERLDRQEAETREGSGR